MRQFVLLVLLVSFLLAGCGATPVEEEDMELCLLYSDRDVDCEEHQVIMYPVT